MKMKEFLKENERYWADRAEGYCQVNIDELRSNKKLEWIDIIKSNAPVFAGDRRLKVLDIGCGPGFFSIILSCAGYDVNFDANWYLHLFDEEKRREYESDRKNVELSGMEDHYTCTDIDSMEDLARQVPLSKIQRPSWDRVVLDKIGFKNIKIDQNIWTKTWNEEEKLNYGSTPMFMIIGEK